MAAAGFLTGGLFYLVLEAGVGRLVGGGGEGEARSKGPWLVYAAVAVDLFSDGLLIGIGSSLSFSLALLLALGQVTADVPEGFATVANFKDKGTPRPQRILLSLSFVIPAVTGALPSFFLLRGAPEALQLTALAFAAGLLLVGSVEEIIGEAHEAAPDSRWATLALAGGFVLFALVASYFESG